ncbi:MAG TPA: aldehyde dehydrogenase family protein, partial [Myxococcales bacterium]
MREVLNFIDGEARPAACGEWLEDVDPATGEAYGRIASSDARDVDAAVAAAVRAFPAWSAAGAAQRAKALRKLARLIERDLEKLARAESVDSGKPLSAARAVDIPRAVQNFDFFADAATQFSSEAHPTDDVALNYTLRRPLGAVACISPWNLPLYLMTWKIAPALAAGNTVVAKPSEVTPVTAHLLGELCGEAGLPPGVLNIVQGLGPRAGAPLCAHGEIEAISFTGSTRVGGEIAREAAKTFKKVSLEMGGKNPTILFADADLRAAVPEAVRAAFSNAGQICLCGSRILVEKSVYPRVRDELVQRAGALRVGDPLEPGTEQGALVSRQHLDKVMRCIATAREEGGKVLCGGERARVPGRCAGGFFVQPTLVEGLGPSCRTN